MDTPNSPPPLTKRQSSTLWDESLTREQVDLVHLYRSRSFKLPDQQYTRRQGSVPLAESLTRRQVTIVHLPKQGNSELPTLRLKQRSSLPVVRWGILALTAFTGIGTGAGVMALLMPKKPTAPETTIAREPKTVVIPPHPEALIPVADNRTLIAAVLREGGKQDPFSAPPQVSPAPQIKAEAMSLPAPLPSVPVRPPIVTEGQPTTRILPPPAAIASMFPNQQVILDLPAPQMVKSPETPVVLNVPTAPQTVASPSVVINRTPVDPSLNVAAVPEVTQPETAGMKLMGVASAGENRIALIRTSPDATPFSASVGDVVSGWKVKTIDEGQVVIVQGDQQQVLKIGG